MHRRPPTARSLVLVPVLLVAALLTSCAGPVTSGDVGPGATTSGGTSAGPPPATAPVVVPAPVPPPSTAGVVDGSLTTPDGRTRTFHVVIPPSAAAATAQGPVPLLVALHGGTGWGLQFRQSSGFDQVAADAGSIVVYPDGVGSGPAADRFRTWNAGTCCGPAMDQQVDDVTFVRLLIDELEAHHRIDPRRVYAAGHSNGAMLSYRLACELSDRIVAVGLQAGALLVEPCTPARPVSLIHLHGTADANVPIGGGVGPRSISRTSYPVPRDGAAAVAAADGCGAPADPVDPMDPARPDLAVTTWSACRDGTEVRFVAVAGASHAWMGATTSSAIAEAVGTPYAGLDASREIWAFLAAHPRA